MRRLWSRASPAAASPRCGRGCEAAWDAAVTEAMGIGDVAVSLWGECEAQDGMHFSGRGFVHVELIDPETGAPRGRSRTAPRASSSTPTWPAGRRRCCASAAATTCACTRSLRLRPHRAADPLHRPHRRHADRARREPVPDRASARSSPASRRRSAAPSRSGRGGRASSRSRRCRSLVELAEGGTATRRRGRGDPRSGCASGCWSATEIELVPWASLPRSDYKSKLVDWTRAEG